LLIRKEINAGRVNRIKTHETKTNVRKPVKKKRKVPPKISKESSATERGPLGKGQKLAYQWPSRRVTREWQNELGGTLL